MADPVLRCPGLSHLELLRLAAQIPDPAVIPTGSSQLVIVGETGMKTTGKAETTAQRHQGLATHRFR